MTGEAAGRIEIEERGVQYTPPVNHKKGEDCIQSARVRQVVEDDASASLATRTGRS